MVGVQDVVGRQIGDQRRARALDPRVERRSQTSVLGQAMNVDPVVGGEWGKRCADVVAGSVVDYDQLPVGFRLGEQRADRPREEGRLVEDRHDDGDPRHRFHTADAAKGSASRPTAGPLEVATPAATGTARFRCVSRS